ncbi:MAG TPA: RelA/SpoT domain-containing protein [Anaerolineae bacterium]|jgi:ppGpp synthetase/RelA/SpoT-type nucleotidyltranferase
MTLINEFISRYRREFEFYQDVSQYCAQQCELALEESGIRAIVTYRAKRPDRLEQKVRRRAGRAQYKTLEDIYSDIVDVAGVRIALYFPGDREQVGQIIREQFELIEPPKDFPAASTPRPGKRFSGYWATHYRIHLDPEKVDHQYKRYAGVRIEIQVASVLMHAWAEVEHDLAYKQLDGGLSDDEDAILDELNGLVLTGEIALERLQKAVEIRIQNLNRPFHNHYELAAYLYDKIHTQKKGRTAEIEVTLPMGRIDILYRLLQMAGLDQPRELARYAVQVNLIAVHKTVADQMVEHVLRDNPSLLAQYQQIKKEMLSTDLDAIRQGDMQPATDAGKES